MEKAKFINMFKDRKDPVTFVEVRKAIDKEAQRRIRRIRLDAAVIKKSIFEIAEQNPVKPSELAAVDTLMSTFDDEEVVMKQKVVVKIESSEDEMEE